jgi:uncharacterized low-complexity protein
MTRKEIAGLVLGTSLMTAPMAMAGDTSAKCGAGKCGGSKDGKTKEQSKCGSAKDKAVDAKCGADKEKKADAKCGTGKCGSTK